MATTKQQKQQKEKVVQPEGYYLTTAEVPIFQVGKRRWVFRRVLNPYGREYIRMYGLVDKGERGEKVDLCRLFITDDFVNKFNEAYKKIISMSTSNNKRKGKKVEEEKEKEEGE